MPRLPIAPRAELVTMGGLEPPLDRLSTCCLYRIGLHGHLVPQGGLEPPPHGLRARHAALTLQRGNVERVAGFEPVVIGLEARGPAVGRHSLWIGLRVSNPSPHAGDVGCSLHTQAEHGPVSFTGPSTNIGCQRPRSFELATAPGVEPGPTSFGGSDAPVTPRCPRHLTLSVTRRHTLPLI